MDSSLMAKKKGCRCPTAPLPGAAAMIDPGSTRVPPRAINPRQTGRRGVPFPVPNVLINTCARRQSAILAHTPITGYTYRLA